MKTTKFTRRDPAHIAEVRAIIIQCAINEQTWSDIFHAVRVKFSVKDWMAVRGVLKMLLNERKIVRDSDVSVERYSFVQ